MAKMYKFLENLFAGSVCTAGVALVGWIVLEVYAFVAYPDSFHTTFHEFEPLETAAPVLYNFTVFFMVAGFIAAAIAGICYYVAKRIRASKKKGRR